MRPETEQALLELIEPRKSRSDVAHYDTLDVDAVFQFIGRVEREAKEDVYSAIGVKAPAVGETWVSLSLDDLHSLGSASSAASATYTSPEYRRVLPVSVLQALDAEFTQLNRAWTKIDQARERLFQQQQKEGRS